ncbi:hypothetical protein JW890_05260 [candidate division WOR-3 bacterium]|nr:hypothetical protein [candidate division WOR-3 bacterium]
MEKKMNFQNAMDKVKTGWSWFQKDIMMYGLTVLVGGLVSSITLGILAGPIMLGVLKAARKQEKDEKVQIGDAFSMMSKFLPSFLLSLVAGAAYFLVMIIYGIFIFVLTAIKLGVCVCIIHPVFITVFLAALIVGQVFLVLGYLLILYEDKSFSEAIKGSIGFIKSNFPKSLEILVSLFICSLFGIIPIVGGIAALGMMAFVSNQYYDELKEAQAL